MIHAPIELGPEVATGVAHDRVVIAKRCGERIEFRGSSLVRRVGLAGFNRSPWTLHADEAVPGSERRAFGGNRRDLDQ